jgi:hypothetical protein
VLALRVVVVLLLVAGLTGCGSSDEEEIRDVFAALEKAREDRDARTACDRLVTVEEPGRAAEGEAEREREQEAEREGGDEGEGEADREAAGCERAFEQTVENARTGLRSYEQDVRKVEVDGHRATADVAIVAVRSDGSEIRRTVKYELAHERGDWRLVLHPE